MDEEQFEVAMKAAFGLSDTQYSRMIAAGPGGGTEDLKQRLRGTLKNEWTKVCEEHAAERAEEACTMLKDGDLLYRDGKYLWLMYNQEFDDALKAVGCRRRTVQVVAAGVAFVEAIERVRCRRLGPLEQRDQIDPGSLAYSPTLGEVMDVQGGP